MPDKTSFRGFISGRKSAFHEKRTARLTAEIEPYIRAGDRILDIGSGSGHIARHLKEKGYAVTSLDVADKCAFEDGHPVLYDGKIIPFADDSFDAALLITVLHHVADPAALLREAKRVAQRIVVIEDLYQGAVQKHLTYAMDSILNREFIGHPHSNKTKEEWKESFKALGLKVVDQRTHTFWRFFTSGTFYLERR